MKFCATKYFKIFKFSLIFLNYRTLLWWVCIAAKILNDKIISNRLYGYLLNLDTAEFNKLEMNVMKRLHFESFINPEMYSLYESQIQEFSDSQEEMLNESLNEYRNDKRIFKDLRMKAKQWSPVNQARGDFTTEYWNNFSDPFISQAIKGKDYWEQETIEPGYDIRFRFNSYNSLRLKRSSSAPRTLF